MALALWSETASRTFLRYIRAKAPGNCLNISFQNPMPTPLKNQVKDKDREIERLRTQLEQQNNKKSLQIETLARMSQSIAQGVYLREILQLIVTMTAEMMGSKICSLMLLDEKNLS